VRSWSVSGIKPRGLESPGLLAYPQITFRHRDVGDANQRTARAFAFGGAEDGDRAADVLIERAPSRGQARRRITSPLLSCRLQTLPSLVLSVRRVPYCVQFLESDVERITWRLATVSVLTLRQLVSMNAEDCNSLMRRSRLITLEFERRPAAIAALLDADVGHAFEHQAIIAQGQHQLIAGGIEAFARDLHLAARLHASPRRSAGRCSGRRS